MANLSELKQMSSQLESIMTSNLWPSSGIDELEEAYWKIYPPKIKS